MTSTMSSVRMWIKRVELAKKKQYRPHLRGSDIRKYMTEKKEKQKNEGEKKENGNSSAVCTKSKLQKNGAGHKQSGLTKLDKWLVQKNTFKKDGKLQNELLRRKL